MRGVLLLTYTHTHTHCCSLTHTQTAIQTLADTCVLLSALPSLSKHPCFPCPW